jgi:Zn-dependent protease
VADISPKNGDPEFHAADYGYGTNRPVQADISSSSAPNKPSRSGLATGALALLGLLLKFKGLALTFGSTFVSAIIWAQYFGWWAFGIGFVLLILIHESGHLLVARALRLPVSLPILIPLMGAFVTMNQRPKTAAEEAQMAIGGPVLGAIAAGACYLGYLATPTSYWGSLLGGLAYFGFFLNLFNLVPVTPLDGGRVLSLLSKWFNVAGLAIAAGLLLFTGLRNPILLLIVLVGAFSTWQRFRSTVETPDYYRVPASTKWMVGGLYLALLLALVLGIEYTHALLPARVG